MSRPDVPQECTSNLFLGLCETVITSSSNVKSSLSTARNVTPAQEKLKTEIELLREDLLGLYKRRDTNLLSQKQAKDLNDKKKELDNMENKLKKLKLDQQRQAKFREAAKRRREDLIDTYPELKKKLKIRDSFGRPRIETDQPLLLSTIVDLATHGSAAHERRQNEVLRSIRTLDQLTTELKNLGFIISRNGLYLRLQPKCSNTIEGS